jgi:hypothetical protein
MKSEYEDGVPLFGYYYDFFVTKIGAGTLQAGRQ